MPATALQPGFPVILGVTGATAGIGLNGGSVYIGVAGADPQTTPQQVWWDAAQTIPASQPLATIGGYITRNGSPAVAYVAADYSMRVRDRAGNQVWFSAFAGAVPESPPYDYNFTFDLTPLSGRAIFVLPIVRTTTFPANFAGSGGFVQGGAPTATYNMVLTNSGGSTVGNIAISTGKAFTFTTTGGTPLVLSAGNALVCIAGTPDATLTNVGVTLRGSR